MTKHIVIALALINLLLSSNAQPVAQLQKGKILTQQIQPSQSYRYSIALKKGEYTKVIVMQKGIDLLVATYSPSGKKLNEFDSPNGANGEEPVEIIADATGKYMIEVKPFDEKQITGTFDVSIQKQLPFNDYATPVINWFKQSGFRISSTEPGNNFQDLQPLKTILQNVAVVGLGEATHGTQEFFSMKHRLIQFLVTEMNYTAICIEGSFAKAQKINDYILGTAQVTSSEQAGWIGETKVMHDMIEWLRTYNASVAKEKKVQFFGLDPQDNKTGIAYVQEYISKVAPELKDLTAAVMDSIRKEDMHSLNFELTTIRQPEFQQLQRLLVFLTLNKYSLIKKTSEAEYENALTYLKQILYFAEFNSDSRIPGAGSRDKYMTENVLYHANKLPPNSKIIVWAHNAHISTKPYGFLPMGFYLKQVFGDKYYATAFSFYEGSFNAQVDRKFPVEVKQFSLNGSPPGTIDWMLNASGLQKAFYNLRNNINSQNVEQWLSEPQKMHWVGALFADTYTSANYLQPFVLKSDFDGIIFIRESTPAKPL
ncbi:MAG: erythromycin esterase family protein [Chitinophagaceae bacterium]|nr:erythromycin esterase family protein [Chitinophagaceae bacterium]